MKNRKFNLIEIILAIGILAIGITSVLSLFPIGFQETRESIAENYSSEAADSMLAYLARESYDSDTWNNLFGSSGAISESKPSSTETSTSGWTNVEGDIYSTGNDGVYGLKVTSVIGDDAITDFTGEVLLWKSKVQNIRAAGQDIGDLDYSEAVALNLEISWPVAKPYNQRNRNTYYLELFNYNQ